MAKRTRKTKRRRFSEDEARTELELEDPQLYFNRELSLLEFDARVLAQAQDPETPLLERLRFLTICSANLDEFFEIRVAGLKEQQAFRVTDVGPARMAPAEVLRQIGEKAQEVVREQYRVLNEELLPELAREGVRIRRRSEWSEAQVDWIRHTYLEQVHPVLTPIGLDPAHPFPRLLNKSLNFIVSLEGHDAFGRDSRFAVVQVPRALPRIWRLPPEVSEEAHDFVLLSSIVHAHVDELFSGMTVTGCYQFRLTRNSELWVDEEEVDNLLQALQGELPNRKYGEAVRLEVADDCPEEVGVFLLKRVRLEEIDLYRVNGPVNAHRLSALYELVDRPDLKYPPFVPGVEPRLRADADFFDVLREGDVLLHHPYQSFQPVLQFLQSAAQDPDVLAIKQTVYRTDRDSPIVEALVDAASAGKEVTAVVELRARFDEAANIDIATRLEEAGANVVYGIVGYKAHAKMVLVVRREGDRLRRYVHLGTGNYHPGTARAYTDIGLLSGDPALGEDVHRLFMQLTGLGAVTKLDKLLQSPFSLHETFLRSVEREIEIARSGRPARIIAKVNSLSEPTVIRALYRASRAGVQVDLIVRGICCLRPGVPDVSDNVRVRSVVGRFLEHPRVYYFYADGAENTWCSSADFLPRNFFRRVEVAFPIEDPELKRRVVHEALELYLADDSQAWTLGQDGRYERLVPPDGSRCSAQDELMAALGDSASDPADARAPQYGHFFIHIGPRQGAAVPPTVGKRELDAVVDHEERERRQRSRAPSAAETNGEPRKDA